MTIPTAARRCFNLLNLLFSYTLSLLFRRVICFGYPIAISIEPTNRCNLHCPECPTGLQELTRPTGSIDLEHFKRYIDTVERRLLYLTLYFQGEPYLNQAFPEMVAYARSKNIYVWSSTNGHYLTERTIRETIAAGLDKLIVSVDGATQESYAQYRIGGTLETVKRGIREFIRIKHEMNARKPSLVIQCLVLKSNEREINDIKRLGKSFGVDRVELKTAQFYEYSAGNPLMPESKKWSRYRLTNKIPCSKRQAPKKRRKTTPISHASDHPLFVPRNPLRNRCFRVWSGCVITWDGKVVPCCYDKNAEYVMGDLNSQSFEEIWQGNKFIAFRRQILCNRKDIPMCRNCGQVW